MGLRFRRSVRIAPGVRVNFGMRGASLTAGVRGASINVGRRGVYANVGLPGTGLSHRERLTPRSERIGAGQGTGASAFMGVTVALQDDGTVELRDEAGSPLPPHLVRVLRTQHAETLRQWLEDGCERWNQDIDAILNLQLDTPGEPFPFAVEPFDQEEPVRPEPAKIDLWARIWPARRRRIEAASARALEDHTRRKHEYEQARGAYEDHVQREHELFEQARTGARRAMLTRLEHQLARLARPRETTAAFDLTDDGGTVFLDVDLPEIEDLPTEQASVAARGLRINIRQRSDTQRRKEYMTHVHAIAFRLVGEVFAALPTIERVVFSGYSQRPDPASGAVRDDYLVSAVVTRVQWQAIDFGNLRALDVVAAFERFELRRKMTKTGVFRPVEPFAPPEPVE